MEIQIGTNPDCHYRLTNPHISRYHCKIVYENGQYYIIDLNSTNGTFVNKQQIPPRTKIPVMPGDLILLAGVEQLDWILIQKMLQPKTQKFSPQELQRNLQNYSPSQQQPLPMQNYGAPSQQHPGNQSQYSQPPPPQQPYQGNYGGAPHRPAAGLGGEIAYAMHMNKSFVGKSFITLALYYFGFYIAGLIANILFMNDAKRTKQIIGHSPPGYGCLVFLFITHIVIPLIFLILIIITGGALWHEIVRAFR